MMVSAIVMVGHAQNLVHFCIFSKNVRDTLNMCAACAVKVLSCIKALSKTLNFKMGRYTMLFAFKAIKMNQALESL